MVDLWNGFIYNKRGVIEMIDIENAKRVFKEYVKDYNPMMEK